MKKLFICFLVLLSAKSAYCQNDTTWYDNNKNECKKKNAVFYRPQPVANDSGYWVKDYYLSGKLKFAGFCQNLAIEDWVGATTWYNEDGSIDFKKTYRQIIKDGELKSYYDNGTPKKKETYKNWKRDGNAYTYFSTGAKCAVIPWKNGLLDGEYISYYKDGSINMRSHYKDNLSDSSYERFDKDGNLIEKRNFSSGIPVKEWFTIKDPGDTLANLYFTNGLINGTYFKKMRNHTDTSQYYTLKDGLLDGYYVEKESEELKRGIFSNGRIVQWSIFNTDSEKIICDAKQLTDSTASWKFYDKETGHLGIEGFSKYDAPFGKWILYKPNGIKYGMYEITKQNSQLKQYYARSLKQYYSVFSLFRLPILYHNSFASILSLQFLLSDIPDTIAINLFDKDGNIIGSGNKLNDLPVGTWKFKKPGGSALTINYNGPININEVVNFIDITYSDTKGQEMDDHSTDNAEPYEIRTIKEEEYTTIIPGFIATETYKADEKISTALASKIAKRSGSRFPGVNWKGRLRGTLAMQGVPRIMSDGAVRDDDDDVTIDLPIIFKTEK